MNARNSKPVAQYEAAQKFWILRIGRRLEEEHTESISTNEALQYPTTVRVTKIRQSIPLIGIYLLTTGDIRKKRWF